MGNKEIDKETVREVEQIFLSLEKEYVLRLLEIPTFVDYLREYFAYSNEELMRRFSKLHEQMENGEVKEEDEGKVELSMIACVLAMSDKIKELILVRTPNFSEGRSNGRGRG